MQLSLTQHNNIKNAVIIQQHNTITNADIIGATQQYNQCSYHWRNTTI